MLCHHNRGYGFSLAVWQMGLYLVRAAVSSVHCWCLIKMQNIRNMLVLWSGDRISVVCWTAGNSSPDVTSYCIMPLCRLSALFAWTFWHKMDRWSENREVWCHLDEVVFWILNTAQTPGARADLRHQLLHVRISRGKHTWKPGPSILHFHNRFWL